VGTVAECMELKYRTLSDENKKNIGTLRLPDKTLAVIDIVLISLVEVLTNRSVCKLQMAEDILKCTYISTSSPHILLRWYKFYYISLNFHWE
jgi:hypothetical protein